MVPVRNGTEYGYGKEFAGLSTCTGTDYFRKMEYGMNSSTDSY